MKLIGDYQVSGLLGRGGMGSVYKVRHVSGGPTRALKLLKPNNLLVSLMGSSEVRRRFVAEARAMSSVSHPNLVKVLHAALDQDQPYYVMEHYCNNLGQLIGEGYDLDAPSRAVEPHRALDFMGQALVGLDVLHQTGIVHRDFKPFNVMLGELDEVKLSDLGLSRLRGEVRPGPTNLRIGSPHYAAPEQEADADSAGPAADLFSVAVSLFRLVTGQLPGGSAATELNPNLDKPWDLFFRKTLDPNPVRRHRDAAEMGRAVDELAEAWRARLSDQCAAPLQWRTSSSPHQAGQRLRDEPRKISLKEAREVLDLDELWRPRAAVEEFEQTLEDMVAGRNHGLLWQRAGSGSVMTWAQAHEYVARLNRQRWMGHGDWRLPTAPEAAVLLLAPGGPFDLCTDRLFDPAQMRIWTCDRCAHTSAWLACFDGGYMGRQDLDCHNFVRAVRSMGNP